MKSEYWQDEHGKSYYDWQDEALTLDPFLDPTESPLTYEDVLITTTCVKKEIEESGYTLAEYTQILHETYLEIYEEFRNSYLADQDYNHGSLF